MFMNQTCFAFFSSFFFCLIIYFFTTNDTEMLQLSINCLFFLACCGCLTRYVVLGFIIFFSLFIYQFAQLCEDFHRRCIFKKSFHFSQKYENTDTNKPIVFCAYANNYYLTNTIDSYD